jgi:DNA-binding transcriptional ArsR family regulator
MSNNRITSGLESFTEMFKALSNPHRLKIFIRLLTCCAPGTVCRVEDEGCACVGDLSRDLDIVPSTVSHHMKELRRAGLIRMRRQGQKIECWVDPAAVRELSDFFSSGILPVSTDHLLAKESEGGPSDSKGENHGPQ